MPVTQEEIAAHLGLSQSAVARLLPELGLEAEASLDEVRLAYIERLRRAAAGNAPSPNREGLLQARRLTAELHYRRLCRQLVDAEALAAEFRRFSRAHRDELLQIADQLGDVLERAEAGQRRRALGAAIRKALQRYAERLEARARELEDGAAGASGTPARAPLEADDA